MNTASYAWSCPVVPDTFRVYENLNGNGFSLAQEVPGTQNSWSHAGIASGNYAVEVTAVRRGTESAPSNIANFVVISTGFLITAVNKELFVMRGQTMQFWINIQSIGGFSGLVSLSISSNANSAISIISQSSVYLQPGSRLLVTAAVATKRQTTLGEFNATIVATSGGTTESIDVLFNVLGADMSFTATGAFSIIGVGLEPSEGTVVTAQRLLDRTNGSIETDLTTIARKSYRNQAAVAGYVAGVSKTSGQLTIEPTSEGISRLLQSMFGSPVSTALVPASGSGGTATSTVAAGAVTGVTVSAPGTLYTSPPTITFTGGSGSGASAIATVVSGAITAITVSNGGTGYTTAPTVVVTQALSFNQHVFTDGFAQSTVSIHEKRGNSMFTFGGCRCNGITATVNKTQGDPVTLMFDMMSLFEILDMTAASIGLDGSIGYDVNGAFSPTNVFATFNNVITAAAQGFTVHPAKSVTERQVLDGYRGPNSHFVEQSNHTGNATLYFGDEIALNKYFGLLESASGARGASKSIIPVPLKMQITYNVDANGNTPGMTLLFPAAIYQRVGQPYRGPGAIMQDIAIMTQHDPVTQTAFQLVLQNYEAAGTSAGQIAATGTVVTGIPVNAQTAYHS